MNSWHFVAIFLTPTGCPGFGEPERPDETCTTSPRWPKISTIPDAEPMVLK